MTVDISVVIPVGPFKGNREWLNECINSALDQTLPPAQLIIIDDMAGLKKHDVPIAVSRLWHSPWRLGVASAFNVGVALSETNCVFMLGSDDTLEQTCLANCAFKYEHVQKPDLSYFYVGVRYSDGREDQYTPCNAAMATKTLWNHTGGFPVEAASGAPDAAFISILMGAGGAAGELVCVNPHTPLYNYRVHPDTDTSKKGTWQGVILETRNLVTLEWATPEWTPRKVVHDG